MKYILSVLVLFCSAWFVSAQPSFRIYDVPSADTVKAQAREWLERAKPDAIRQFESVWEQDTTPLDRLADTFALAPPTADPFCKSNLTLIRARTLVQNRFYEEALEALTSIKAEEVVDPASYFFLRAVCEHGLMMKTEATISVNRLLEDVFTPPERYKAVAVMMAFDMETWQEKDLGEIARKMANIERRLELAKGGPQTQKLQREVVNRLDEMIKKLENKVKDDNDDSCPDGTPRQDGPSMPSDSIKPIEWPQIGGVSGTGRVNQAKLRDLSTRWGEMSERERAEVMQDLTHGMSQVHRQVIENYFRNIAKSR